MTNKDNSERIERFLRDQMSPEENQAFLDDLRSDKPLREEAQIMALLIKGMKEEQARMEDEMKSMADEKTIIPIAASKPLIPANGTNAAARRKSKWIYWAGAVAAMFIIVFGAVKFFSPQDNGNQAQPSINIKVSVKDKKIKKIKKNKKTTGQKDFTANEVNKLPTVIEDPNDNTDIADNATESDTGEEKKEEVKIKIVDDSHQVHQAAP